MKLHVPVSAIEAYRTTAPWSGFGSIVALTEEELSVMSMKNLEDGSTQGDVTDCFRVNGWRVRGNGKGLNIIRNGEGRTMKVMKR